MRTLNATLFCLIFASMWLACDAPVSKKTKWTSRYNPEKKTAPILPVKPTIKKAIETPEEPEEDELEFETLDLEKQRKFACRQARIRGGCKDTSGVKFNVFTHSKIVSINVGGEQRKNLSKREDIVQVAGEIGEQHWKKLTFTTLDGTTCDFEGIGRLIPAESCQMRSTKAVPQCDFLCATEGLCRDELTACSAASSEQCRNSLSCKAYGECGFKNGNCEPTSDDDCRNTPGCKTKGECSFDTGDDTCIALKKSDCKRSDGCRDSKRCEFQPSAYILLNRRQGGWGGPSECVTKRELAEFKKEKRKLERKQHQNNKQ